MPEDVLKWLTPKRAHIASQGWDALDSKVWGQNKTLNVGYSNKATKRPYDIGTGVNHAKFGSGVVVSYEGEGDDQRIQINFGRQGNEVAHVEFGEAGTQLIALAKLSPRLSPTRQGCQV